MCVIYMKGSSDKKRSKNPESINRSNRTMLGGQKVTMNRRRGILLTISFYFLILLGCAISLTNGFSFPSIQRFKFARLFSSRGAEGFDGKKLYQANATEVAAMLNIILPMSVETCKKIESASLDGATLVVTDKPWMESLQIFDEIEIRKILHSRDRYVDAERQRKEEEKAKKAEREAIRNATIKDIFMIYDKIESPGRFIFLSQDKFDGILNKLDLMGLRKANRKEGDLALIVDIKFLENGQVYVGVPNKRDDVDFNPEKEVKEMLKSVRTKAD